MPILKKKLEKMKMSVNIYDFLTHDEAEEVGRRQRTAEKTTTDVSFLDIATSQAVVVKQIFNPLDEVCRGRVEEVFGPDWQRTMTNESCKGEQKGIRKKLFDRVNNTIQRQLGLKHQKKNYFATFVYALALDPERPSLQILRQYFLDQNAQIVKAKAAKVQSVARAAKHSAGEASGEADDASATEYTPRSITVTAMGAFFSLTPYSQGTQLVKDLLRDRGLTEEFRWVCYDHFVVLEVVRAMVTGLVTRRHCSVDPHPYQGGDVIPMITAEMNDLALMVKTFVSVEEGAAVAGEGHEFISGLHNDVDFWMPHLVRFALELEEQGPLLKGSFNISKKALSSSLSRRTTAFKKGGGQGPNPANCSNLQPGWGKEPHVSTSGTEPDYTTRTWDDWFTYEVRGEDGNFNPKYIHRMLATVFGLLIVDRSLVGLSSRHELPDRRGTFRELLGAIPPVGAGARLTALLKNQEAVKGKLQVKDQSFFGEERLTLLFGDDQAPGGERVNQSAEREPADDGSAFDCSNGGGEPAPMRGSKGPQEKFDVSIIRDADDHDADEVSVRWPKSVVEQLGLLDDDGKLTCLDGVFRFTITKKATKDTAKKRKKSTAADIRMGRKTKMQKTTAQPPEEGGETTSGPVSSTPTTKQQTKRKGKTGKQKASDGLAGTEEVAEGGEDKDDQSVDDSPDDSPGQGEEEAEQGEEEAGQGEEEEDSSDPEDSDSIFLMNDNGHGNGRLHEAAGEEDKTNFHPATFPPSPSSDKVTPVPTPVSTPTGTPSTKTTAEPSTETCEGGGHNSYHITRVKQAVEKAKAESTKNVGGLSKFFKVECKDVFFSVWGAAKGNNCRGGNMYIFCPPGVHVNTDKKIPAEWLEDHKIAPNIFFDGNAAGSLVDLVTGTHGTTFPRDCSADGLTLDGRTRGSSKK